MSRRSSPTTALAALATLALTGPVLGQSMSSLGEFHDWNAFSEGDGRAKVCHVSSQPKQSQGQVSGREDAFAVIAHGPGPKNGVVSIIAGYTYKPQSQVTVTVDGRDFTLFTDKDRAWTYTDADDKALLEAMVKGRQMTVKGTPSRGAETTDTYSLSGVSRALEAIDQACQVKR